MAEGKRGSLVSPSSAEEGAPVWSLHLQGDVVEMEKKVQKGVTRMMATGGTSLCGVWGSTV